MICCVGLLDQRLPKLSNKKRGPVGQYAAHLKDHRLHCCIECLERASQIRASQCLVVGSDRSAGVCTRRFHLLKQIREEPTRQDVPAS